LFESSRHDAFNQHGLVGHRHVPVSAGRSDVPLDAVFVMSDNRDHRGVARFVAEQPKQLGGSSIRGRDFDDDYQHPIPANSPEHLQSLAGYQTQPAVLLTHQPEAFRWLASERHDGNLVIQFWPHPFIPHKCEQLHNTKRARRPDVFWNARKCRAGMVIRQRGER
jgi:hypothetical protein